MSICSARASEDAGKRTSVHLRDCIVRVTRKKRGDARSLQGKPSKCRGLCIQRAYRAKDTRGRSVPPLSLSLFSLCVVCNDRRSSIRHSIDAMLGCSRKREPPVVVNVTRIFLEKYAQDRSNGVCLMFDYGWNFTINDQTAVNDESRLN